MKNILTLLLLVLSLNAFAQQPAQKQQPNTYTQTEVDLKLQQQELKSLQKDMAAQKEAIKESIDRQERYIQKTDKNVSWWIAAFGILVALIGIGITIFGIIINQRTKRSQRGIEIEAGNVRNLRRDVEEEARNINSLKNEINTQKIEIEKIKDEAQIHLNEIKKKTEDLDKLVKETTEKISSNKELSPQEKEEVQKVVEEIKETKTEAKYSADDWFLKGYNAQMEKKHDDARFYYQKVIDLDPNDAATLNNLGNALTNLAKQKNDEPLHYEAIKKYKKATELNPNDAAAYNNWGIALVGIAQLNNSLEEKKDEIIKLLNKAEALEKGSGSYNFACLYALLNEKETAFEWLEKSLQYEEKDSREYYEQVEQDFNNIKEDPRFTELLDKYFPNK